MLVTTAELATYMDLRFDNRQTDAAELILAGVQGEIEALLRRPIEVEEYDEEYFVPEDYLLISASAYFYDRSLDATADSLALVAQPPFQLHLNNTPVRNVSLVRIKGRLDTTWRTLEFGKHYAFTRWGVDIWTAFQYDRINVVYEAGLDGSAIPFLRLSILRAAAREMQTQTDDVLGLKDIQASEPKSVFVGLTEDEKKALKRYKRKQI